MRTPTKIKEDKTTNLKEVYSFEKFDAQVKELDSILKQEGVFVIKTSHYRFCDSAVAPKYKTLSVPSIKKDRCLKFDKNSRLIKDSDYNEIVFVKSA